MARTEPSNINQCVAPCITPRACSFPKDNIQCSDEIKTEFTSREGTYKISSLIDNLGKIGTNTCLSEPVRITVLPRIQAVFDAATSQTSSRRSSSANQPLEHASDAKATNGNEFSQTQPNVLLTDILAFNVGRELIVYEFAEATQVNINERFVVRIER